MDTIKYKVPDPGIDVVTCKFICLGT